MGLVFGAFDRTILGFWNKALPFILDDYSSFEKQLLARYLPDLSRGLMLSNGPPSYHVTWAAHHKMGDVWPTKPKICRYTAALHHPKEVVQFSWSLLLLHYLLYPRLAPVALCSVPLWSVVRARKDLGLVYIWFCMIYRYHLHVDSYSTRAFSEHLWRRWWKKILPELKWMCLAVCLGGELARCVVKYQSMGPGQWFSWTISDLGGIWLENC